MSKINKKILIVEDDPAIAKALRDKFTLEGFEVLYAENGTKGVELAKDESLDLLLLDLILPGIDGLAVLEEVRNNAPTKHLPVIVLTNVSNEKVEEEAKKFDVMMFLVKTDWKIDDVVSKVRSALNV